MEYTRHGPRPCYGLYGLVLPAILDGRPAPDVLVTMRKDRRNARDEAKRLDREEVALGETLPPSGCGPLPLQRQ